jgi:hypothetical protein
VVLEVAGLSGDAQVQAMRNLLRHPPYNYDSFVDSVFFHEAQLRSSLRRLVPDRKSGQEAARLLALIAEPEDLRAIFRRPPNVKWIFEQWPYYVATAMLDASTDEDWTFLQRCVLGGYTTPWAVSGAIQTLRLIASPRSIALLQQAERQNQHWTAEIRQALQYARSEPLSLTASGLSELMDPASQAARAGRWTGTGKPHFNEAGDKALVDLRFESGRDRYVYTATLHRIGDHWRICALRESAQAYAGPSGNGQEW